MSHRSVVFCLFATLVAGSLYAGGGGNVNNNNTANFNQVAGVEIDANGVLRVKQFSKEVTQQRIAAARVNLPKDLAEPSKLRKVSLRRLEQAAAEQLNKTGKVGEDMAAVAGLTSLDYVFFYPEHDEIVIAGPAEGFAEDASGRVRGIESGKPVLLLEDLVVAMRSFPPQQDSNSIISVSIDPTEQGLNRMQQFLASVRGRVRPSDALRLASGLKNAMGMQTVTFRGVPTSTHFAQVLVEADYRMKLIGIGLEKPPIRLLSYVDRANPRQVSANAMERWYFMPDYNCVRVSEDMLGMQLVGNSVRLVSEAERVANGQRQATARINKASQAFCQDFTENYEKIADTVVVYAQLRNLIDISIAAAYIQKQDFYTQAGWGMEVFASEDEFPVETHSAPVQVETAVNAIWRGNTLMTPLGGGVHLQPRVALNRDRIQEDNGNEVEQMRGNSELAELQPGQWWWD